ncbi:unnamed protein product [Echinostoma caproni]|uniref:C3H1-type domain-containing protein n=1 Tax=Echinostoma caproni TaxID=27848 RepID=A0A183A723_9TREM|nr:unnamed protein product [Echinostoma caproni]
MGLTQLGGATLPLSFAAAGSDPNALNTSALLAAAAALQQQQQTVPGSGLLVTTSSAKASMTGDPVTLGQHLSAGSRATTLLSTSTANGICSGNGTLSSKSVLSGSEPILPAFCSLCPPIHPAAYTYNLRVCLRHLLGATSIHSVTHPSPILLPNRDRRRRHCRLRCVVILVSMSLFCHPQQQKQQAAVAAFHAVARAVETTGDEHNTTGAKAITSTAPISVAKLESTPTATVPVSLVSSMSSPAVRAGMKREAASCSTSTSNSVGTANAGLDMHPWYPPKRANHTGGYSGEATPKASDSMDNNGSAGTMCNGNGPHSCQDRPNSESSVSTSVTGDYVSDSNNTLNQVFASTTAGLTFSPAFYGSVAPHLTPSSAAVSSLLNPMNVNLYGLPLSNAQTASPYVSPQLAPYSSTIYSTPTDNPNSMATAAAAALALNSWLQQQQQQQQQTHPQQPPQQPTATPTHPLLSTQVPGTHPLSTPSALAAALAAVQQQQQQQSHNPAELHPSAQQQTQHSPAFQHHSQQQALLLSTLIRAQQSQLAAAQMAAAVQAAGYLQTNTSPRPIGILDPSYQIPGALAGLQASPYATSFPCVQNPITNVAYINDKGHLLETLPICRDFKAGKCHRNGDCRYVHLVDENVEVNQGRVIVCRDAAKGRCTRVPCKYYHVPLHAISANRSLALNSVLANAAGVPSSSTGSASGVGGQGL